MYTENYLQTGDGLRLFYRDYHAPDSDGLPLICLHGLTRNSADFADFALKFASQYRLIAPDMRGRGLSDYDSNWQNYHLETYVSDVWHLLQQLGIQEFNLVGNSMGGLMSMIMCHQQPDRIRSVVLNDIGPELAPEGIERIMNYLEVEQSRFTLEQAVQNVRLVNEENFPDFTDEDWLAFTLRIYKEVGEDEYQTSYDKGITRALVEGTPMPHDPWQAFESLADKPLLVVRGGLSDLLSPEILDKMKAIAPNMEVLEIPRMGHHPFLDEPQSVEAIRKLLARV